jgi:hypothetical protein
VKDEERHGSCKDSYAMGEHDDDLELSPAAESGAQSVAAAIASGLNRIAVAIERGLREVAAAIASADAGPGKAPHKR